MISKLIEEISTNFKVYYKVIQTETPYSDGRNFPINEVIFPDNEINFETDEHSKLGGLYVSDIEHVFRWLVRGDTLCEVIIPEDGTIYKTTSKKGIYVADRIILRNPIKIDDALAYDLYKKSTLDFETIMQAMAACAIRGHIDTALKICTELVNKDNIDVAIKEFEGFCERREKDMYLKDFLKNPNVKKLYDTLLNIKNKEHF